MKIYFLIIWLLTINIISFLLFFIDKKKAINNKWRIKESTLLLFCLIGGSIGGLSAMKMFHHKTKKNKFRAGVPIIILFQIIAVITYLYLKNE